MDKTTIIDVAIIGGGASGLYSAQLLKKKGKQVIVLEANKEVGGRVKTLPAEEFGPVPIDLGAHFIHGSQNNVIVDIGKTQNWEIMNLGGWPDYWTVPTVTGKIILDNNDERHPVMKKIKEHLLLLEEYKDSAELGGVGPKDLSLGAWLRARKLPDWAIRLADASVANDYGACIETVGVNAAAWENQHWCHGVDYLAFKDAPFTTIIDHLKKDLDIRTYAQVLVVDYTNPEYVLLKCRDTRSNQEFQVRAKSVIVSVSVPILRDGDIKFNPELPVAKQQALKRLGFGNAIKILLKFDTQFWPVDCYDIVCGEEGSFVPEYWFDEYVDKKTNKKVYFVTGFAAGRHADDVSRHSDEEVIRQSLQHLDRLFKRQTSIRSKTPASDHFIQGKVFDWGKEPFIKGGYSYPALNPTGSTIQDIRTYQLPVRGRIFFCGEATNEKLNPTVNGAMNTSERVVQQVMMGLGYNTAKL